MACEVEAVRRLWAVAAHTGLPSTIPLLHPDVVARPATAGGRELCGREALKEHIAALAAAGVEVDAHVDVLEDLGAGLVLARGTLCVERWGSLSASTTHWLHRVEQGRIVEVGAHGSRARALAAARARQLV